MKKILLFLFLLFPVIGYCSTSQNNTYTISAPLTTQIDYNGTSNAVYVGSAASGASITSAMWQIEYITYNATGDALTVQWSPNYKNFGDIWASRSSLSYS